MEIFKPKIYSKCTKCKKEFKYPLNGSLKFLEHKNKIMWLCEKCFNLYFVFCKKCKEQILSDSISSENLCIICTINDL
jgi:hypothetical protein